MTEEERREMMRSNYAAQMEMLGYDASGNPLDDIVRVVRCKDCKDGKVTEHGELFCEWHYGFNPADGGPNGYCSHGKRRDDDA